MSPFHHILRSIIFLISCFIFMGQSNAGLIHDLQDGQHVILIRHADAPGYGDPVGYTIGQCSTQRNLGDYGKKQASAIGIWLSKQGIETAQIYSSPWCRCLDTAHLLNKGPVTTESSLGSFFDNMNLEKKQTKELESFIKSTLTKHPQTPIILVTHHVNIEAYTGKVVSVGDIVLVKVDKDGKHISHTVYPSPKN